MENQIGQFKDPYGRFQLANRSNNANLTTPPPGFEESFEPEKISCNQLARCVKNFGQNLTDPDQQLLAKEFFQRTLGPDMGTCEAVAIFFSLSKLLQKKSNQTTILEIWEGMLAGHQKADAATLTANSNHNEMSNRRKKSLLSMLCECATAEALQTIWPFFLAIDDRAKREIFAHNLEETYRLRQQDPNPDFSRNCLDTIAENCSSSRDLNFIFDFWETTLEKEKLGLVKNEVDRFWPKFNELSQQNNARNEFIEVKFFDIGLLLADCMDTKPGKKAFIRLLYRVQNTHLGNRSKGLENMTTSPCVFDYSHQMMEVFINEIQLALQEKRTAKEIYFCLAKKLETSLEEMERAGLYRTISSIFDRFQENHVRRTLISEEQKIWFDSLLKQTKIAATENEVHAVALTEEIHGRLVTPTANEDLITKQKRIDEIFNSWLIHINHLQGSLKGNLIIFLEDVLDFLGQANQLEAAIPLVDLTKKMLNRTAAETYFARFITLAIGRLLASTPLWESENDRSEQISGILRIWNTFLSEAGTRLPAIKNSKEVDQLLSDVISKMYDANGFKKVISRTIFGQKFLKKMMKTKAIAADLGDHVGEKKFDEFLRQAAYLYALDEVHASDCLEQILHSWKNSIACEKVFQSLPNDVKFSTFLVHCDNHINSYWQLLKISEDQLKRGENPCFDASKEFVNFSEPRWEPFF